MKYEGRKKPATQTTIFCYVIGYFEKGINTVKYRVIAMLVAEVALVLVTPYILYIFLYYVILIAYMRNMHKKMLP